MNTMINDTNVAKKPSKCRRGILPQSKFYYKSSTRASNKIFIPYLHMSPE